MAKPGMDAADASGILADLSNKEGWVLCVGAGLSRPAFPNWTELVERLMEDVSGVAGPALACALLKGFPPDALIQAAQDRMGLSDDLFRDKLTALLYRDLATALGDDFQLFCDVLASRRPVSGSKTEWREFLDLVRNNWGTIGSLAVADVLLRIVETGKAPLGVLSFNAEPLLLALTNALEVERFVAKGVVPPTAGDRRQVFDYVTHSAARRRSDRVPYVFLHGLLEVPDPSGTHERSSSADKLVFSEGEYLNLANSAFSWQSTTFLEAAASHHLVFIGVSLSDPNMRRWLAWAHRNRMTELEGRHGATESTTHYWLTRRPSDSDKASWIESAVAHLGVRVVWLEDWGEVGPTLTGMLGE